MSPRSKPSDDDPDWDEPRYSLGGFGGLFDLALTCSDEQLQAMLRTVRKLMIFVVGVTVLLFGLALLVLPGPAFLVIPLGLAILATEFVWARWMLRIVQERIQQVANKVRRRPGETGTGTGTTAPCAPVEGSKSDTAPPVSAPVNEVASSERSSRDGDGPTSSAPHSP